MVAALKILCIGINKLSFCTESVNVMDEKELRKKIFKEQINLIFSYWLALISINCILDFLGYYTHLFYFIGFLSSWIVMLIGSSIVEYKVRKKYGQN